MESFGRMSWRCMVPSMETTFLTIAEACEKTGRSASTVRRLIKSIADHDDHADRAGIEPAPKEINAFKKKGENFTWRIREDVLMSNFKSAQKEVKKSAAEPTGDIMSIIQKELELKNQQIEKQWEVIHALNDRLREGNILMGSLQKRLGPAPQDQADDAVVEASAATPSPEVVTVGAGKSSKKGIFGWMRR